MDKQQILDTFGGKPSGALKLMLEGLLAEDRPFEIEMTTYGHQIGVTCFGCAATSASWKLHQKKSRDFQLVVSNRWLMSDPFPLRNSVRPLIDFEKAIDAARSGSMVWLFEYCGIMNVDEGDQVLLRGLDLGTGSWKAKIPLVEQRIKDLEAKGY